MDGGGALLLDALRAGVSKNAFAAQLGISRRMLSYLYAGRRGVGRRTLAAFLEQFPVRREDILSVFVLNEEVRDGG